MEHPAQDLLLRFVLGVASRAENRTVVRHLLARCPVCAAALRKLRREPPSSPPRNQEEYDPAFDRLAALLGDLNDRANAEEGPEGGRLPGFLTSGSAARRRCCFG